MADPPAIPPLDGSPAEEAPAKRAGAGESPEELPGVGAPVRESARAASGNPPAAASPAEGARVPESGRALSGTASPTFDVRPTASTQARWPGQVHRGSVTLIGGGAALGAGLFLLVLGPVSQQPGFFLAGLLGVFLGALVLVVGVIQYARGGYAVPSMRRWQVAVLGAAVPIALGLLLAGLVASAG